MIIDKKLDEKFGGYFSYLQSINKSDETVKQAQKALKKFIESGCDNTLDFVGWYSLNYPEIKEATVKLYKQNIDRYLKWQSNNSTDINNNMDMSDINNSTDINNNMDMSDINNNTDINDNININDNIKSMDNKRSKKSITFGVDADLQEKFLRLATMIQKTQTEILTAYMQNFVSQNEVKLKEFERLKNEVVMK